LYDETQIQSTDLVIDLFDEEIKIQLIDLVIDLFDEDQEII
jgi:hypothetical protein